MTNPEELKRKLSNPLPGSVIHQQYGLQTGNSSSTLSSSSSYGTSVPTTTTTTAAQRAEPERTYIFPAGSNSVTVSMIGGSDSDGTSAVGMVGSSRGHSRSVSHGGGQIGTPSGTSGRPLKSAMRGHQRALSHGQISNVTEPGQGSSQEKSSSQQTRSGHSRVGSKTDFILPPGHKDTLDVRDFPSNASSARPGGGPGHSRQASRSESIYTLRRAEKPPWWKRFPFCRNNKDKFEDNRGYRIVVPNHTVPPKTPKRDHPNGRRIGNKIRTTKYTLLSFIPKNLLEQFHRVANLYFIFIVLLNWFPAINAFGKEIAMIPVVFVLGVTAIKDLFEDRRRRSSDKRINNTTCRVYNG